MSLSAWVDKLNQSNSRLHKETILKEAYTASSLGNKTATNFLEGLNFCYNPYYTYGIKQIPKSSGISTTTEDAWDKFIIILEKLRNRELSGNNAKDAVVALSLVFSSEDWNKFIAPIMRRDIRCKISIKTINKVIGNDPNFVIPVFECQLAMKSEGRPELKGKKRLEPKFDGVRVLMTVNTSSWKDNVIINTYSRNGKVFFNFSHIEDQVKKYLVRAIHDDDLLKHTGGFVLDGEIIGESFQKLMRQARRKKNVSNDDSIFQIFDIIPIDDFTNGLCKIPLRKRINVLEKLSNDFSKCKNVNLISNIEVDLDTEEGRNQLQEYASQMVNEGAEGIMIKDMDAPYKATRTAAWLKWKPTINVDLPVIGVEEGVGDLKGKLGSLICKGIDYGKEIYIHVGTGFSDDEREELWKNRDNIIGQVIEILADAITQNKNGSYSLRFARFVRFREDK